MLKYNPMHMEGVPAGPEPTQGAASTTRVGTAGLSSAVSVGCEANEGYTVDVSLIVDVLARQCECHDLALCTGLKQCTCCEPTALLTTSHS